MVIVGMVPTFQSFTGVNKTFVRGIHGRPTKVF